MTQVDFYVLKESDASARYHFACRLIEKAYKLGHRVYVHTEDKSAAHNLDAFMWDFRPCSFLPHSLFGEDNLIGESSLSTENGLSETSGSHAAQVEIGFGQDPTEHHDLLVNLAAEVPGFFSRFERVAEVVIQDENIVATTRQHYALYRNRGYPLKSHDLRKR